MMKMTITKLALTLLATGLIQIFTSTTTQAATIYKISNASPFQVPLAWCGSPDSRVTGYYLYYTLVGSSVTNRVDVSTNTSVMIKGLRPGIAYSFVVTAHDANGNESDPTNDINYTASITQSFVNTMSNPTDQNTERQNIVLSQLLAPTQNRGLAIAFKGVAGTIYHIESSSDLINWTTILTTNCATDGQMSIPLVIDLSEQSRFFRMSQD